MFVSPSPFSTDTIGASANSRQTFIIDDSADMAQYVETKIKDKPDVARLLRLLGYITKQFDPNGVDLYFMNSKETVKKCKRAEKMDSALKACKFEGASDMRFCLQKHLQEYRGRIVARQQGKAKFREFFSGNATDPPRPQTFYVFTDGRWLRREENGQEFIKGLMEQMVASGLKKGQVGIQFISFGDDEDGLRRLDELDEYNKELGMELYVLSCTTPSYV